MPAVPGALRPTHVTAADGDDQVKPASHPLTHAKLFPRFSAPSPRTMPYQWTDLFAAPNTAGEPAGVRNRLYFGDNRDALREMAGHLAGQVDLVYLDPPFRTSRRWNARVPVGDATGVGPTREQTHTVPAYRDIWTPADYLTMLGERLDLARELLSPTGSLIVHVDWRVGPHVQLLLDEIFGPGERAGPGRAGFRAEIIWGYGGGGAPHNTYRRKHDNLFWYTRSRKWTFHPEFRPYTDKTMARGLTAVKGPAYALRQEGAARDTCWTDPGVQKILSPTARENWKYPTQKPTALLHRLIRIHSNPGEIVLDPFAGSGTTAVAAQELGRRWVLADASPLAVWIAIRRLCQVQDHAASDAEAFALYQQDLPPCTGGQVRAVRNQSESGSVWWTLTGSPPGSSSGAEAVHRHPLDLVEYWALDPAFGTVQDPAGRPVFRHMWRTFRAPGSRSLVRSSGLFAPAAGSSPVLTLVDPLGRAERERL